MKIEVKYNIDFGKALKVLNEQSLDKYINAAVEIFDRDDAIKEKEI